MRNAAPKLATPRTWYPTLLCAGAKESEVAGRGKQGGRGGVRSGGRGQIYQSSLDYWDQGARDVCDYILLLFLSFLFCSFSRPSPALGSFLVKGSFSLSLLLVLVSVKHLRTIMIITGTSLKKQNSLPEVKTLNYHLC